LQNAEPRLAPDLHRTRSFGQVNMKLGGRVRPVTLDAHVCCDCFERGQLRHPPPRGCELSVTDDGGLLCGSDDLDVQIAFDRWQHSEACEHENGYLVSHRIGNIALVAALRAELGRWPERFSVTLSRVIYDGTHSGDFVPPAQVLLLAPEVEALATVRCPDPEMEQSMRGFEAQMRELVAATLRMGKPLVF
jgi:hypothetical protein